VIIIKDEPFECTSESINNNTSEVDAIHTEKTVIKLDKLKLVPSAQDAANSKA
jgi:hypothetical protein